MTPQIADHGGIEGPWGAKMSPLTITGAGKEGLNPVLELDSSYSHVGTYQAPVGRVVNRSLPPLACAFAHIIPHAVDAR